MYYIDIHTHKAENYLNSIVIRNYFPEDLNEIPAGTLFSCGLHPWHLNNSNPKEIIRKLEAKFTNLNLLAIGECGLDRHIDTDFEFQKEVFVMQARLASKFQKPMIIHSVKAHYDIIGLRKSFSKSPAWIIHGFRGNKTEAKEFIRNGFYLSFGKHLVEKNISLHEIFCNIPIDNIFFETDADDISIEEVYANGCSILNIEEEKLKKKLAENFKRVFKNDLL